MFRIGINVGLTTSKKRMVNTSLERLRLTQQHLLATTSNRVSDQKNHYGSVTRGSKYTPDYRKYLKQDNGKIASYFHDIPMNLNKQDATLNIVVEIPRWTNGKFEIDTKAPGNPIRQDIKKGKVRFVNNLFPHHGYLHNYGAIPQTWEDPEVKNEELDLFGDGDPLDVVEVGSNVAKIGDIKQVKVLGSLALIDEGELDWKIVVVDLEDPLSKEMNDIYDVFMVLPGLLEDTRMWFKNYKRPTGKPINKFAFNGQYKNQEETLAVIEECHESWKLLVAGKKKADLNIANSTLSETPGFGQLETLNDLKNDPQPDAEIPQEVNKSYYYQF